MTGPASRPPLKNASSPMINQDISSEYVNPLYHGSQGSQHGDVIQPSNFNFAPRTAGAIHTGGGGLGATNMLSDADFDRATDIEDNEDEEQSYYVEEEVTDDEAMEKQKQQLKAQRRLQDPDYDSDDDSDMGGYIPSALRSDTPTKPKPPKITKKVRTRKKKTISAKKPPRQASPPLGGRKPLKIGGSDNIQRKSQTMSEEAKNAMQMSNQNT